MSTPIPANQGDIFHFSDDQRNFDDLARENGFTYWQASELMERFGYQSWSSFSKVVQKAISACVSLNIDILENFEQFYQDREGKKVPDYKLSRFACYLVAMNGDPKKPEVARAQGFFAAVAESFRKYVEEAEEIERILVRDEISEHEKSLTGMAKKAGVEQYGLFQNAGYRGLYNMNLRNLKKLKGIPDKRTPLDFMGKTELAANLFRITQTEAKMRNEGVQGQRQAEDTAFHVGREVRDTMKRISGITPESLPPSEDIKKVKSAVKSSQKEFKKIDKK